MVGIGRFGPYLWGAGKERAKMVDNRAAAVWWLAVAIAVGLPTMAMANTPVLSQLCAITSDLVQWLVGIGYVSGAIGLALVGIKAATGSFASGPFLTIMGSMFLLGSVPAFVSFLISGSFSWTC